MPLNTSFLKRRLQIYLTLKKGAFADGSNSKVITDLAMTADIEKLGPPDFGKCSVTIQGMLLEDMEQLTTLSFNPLFGYTSRNYINIYAGDDLNGFAEVFAGSITSAGAEFGDGQPGATFKIEGQIGFMGSVTPQSPGAVHGTQSVESFIQKQAAACGMDFENAGVTATIKDCIFNGSAIEQAQQAATRVGAELILDDNKMVLLPANGAREGQIVLLNRDSGLLGYPKITQSGVEVRAIFNPAFKFASCFKLETVVPKASSTWRIIKLVHKLSSNHPREGAWESHLTGYYPAMSGATGKF